MLLNPNICLDDYILKVNSSCSEVNTYEKFVLPSDAEDACNSDNECIGIYDENCDQEGSYRLCKKGFMTLLIDPSCLYKKKKYYGRQQVKILHLNAYI